MAKSDFKLKGPGQGLAWASQGTEMYVFSRENHRICSESTCFYVQSPKMSPKGDWGPLQGMDKTHMFVENACFLVCLAIWPEGGPWRGGKGGGIMNPPPDEF